MNSGSPLIAVALCLSAVPVSASEVPSRIPDADGRPGNANKPVQVYILAGQSNMVGMGNIRGAKNVYTGVYLSSDPAVPDGPFQIYRVGKYKTSPLQVYLPDGTATDKPVAAGALEVPQQGVYQLHCGFGRSSYSVMHLDGKEVYRRQAGGQVIKQDVTLKPGRRYTFKISGFTDTPPRFWMQKTDLLGNGDLEAVVKREGKFPWLVDREGNWTVRNDVYFQEARLAKDGKGSPLSATSNGRSIGPELGFGHVLGTFHDEQVLLIKTAQGNRSLGFDFRPPSSGRTDPDNMFEAAEYRLMVEGVRKTLKNIDKVVPGYSGQGYEIAGFAWFQGHKDSFAEQSIADYEKHLVNLINDVRQEFQRPKLPVVVASIGFGGNNMQDKFVRILKAQMAVGDAKQHPEYAGTVSSVDTRAFWREVDESPANQDYHYHRNAETYLLIGDALGRAMVGLLGGQAQPLPQAPRPRRVTAQQTAEPSEAEQAAARRALQPIIVDGIAADYIAHPRNNASLLREASGERPQRANQFLRGSMFGLINCYRAAGIDAYDWHAFGPDLNNVRWDYFSFDPPETLPVEKKNRYRKVTYPTGMANWVAADFDAAQAGWKTGLQPFGQLDGKPVAISTSCKSPFCRCGEKPKTLWEKEVLLMRGTLEMPRLKAGHRYRIVLGGAAHVNSGEGYAIYVNGRLLAESNAGVAVRQGGQPRGAHIYKDFREDFNGGRVTIAVTSFLRYSHPRIKPYPPRGHITLAIEEQKLAPLTTASDQGMSALNQDVKTSDLQNPVIRNKVVSQAVDLRTLQKRGDTRDALYYVPTKQSPYTGWVKEMNVNGDLGSLGRTKRGKLDGPWISWDADQHQTLEAGVYKDGNRHGLWTSWYGHGQKESEGTYRDGRLMSVIVWKPDGKVCPDTELKHGQGTRCSYMVLRQLHAKKLTEYTYKDGLMHGPYTLWCWWSDSKQEHGHFHHGSKNGPYTEWYGNGRKRSEGVYQAGRLRSAVVWKPDGQRCSVTRVQDGNGSYVFYGKNEAIKYTYRNGKQVRVTALVP